MTPEDRWPGYTPEAQAYEIATRPKIAAMTTDEERDLAVTARREAAAMRHRAWERDRDETPCATCGQSASAHPTDDCAWPCLPGCDCDASRGEPDGPPDTYWEPIDDSGYRAAMRDAGRGHLLRW